MGHIYGPVPSRRLGRSLGIDLVPFKTCTYDCIYCQLGRTTNKTTERREWVPLDDLIAELEDKLATNPDYVTLSGSGEPTLYSRLDELIDRVRSITRIPVAVLTNGSLLWQQGLRRQLLGAQLVIPSLDAGDETMFHAVNRPHPSISFEQMLDGLMTFRNEYRGQYWLEVFLLAGHTAIPAEAGKIVESVSKIRPDRVQLNTVARPAAEEYAQPVDRRRLGELAALFDPPAEVIADFHGGGAAGTFTAARDAILEMLRRRPCSVEGIADGLGIHPNEAAKYLEELRAASLVEEVRTRDGLCYCARRGPDV